MYFSLIALLLLLPYLWRQKQLCLFFIVLSIIPQYHIRSALYHLTGFSNHYLVYGASFDQIIPDVEIYLDLIFLFFAFIIFLYIKFSSAIQFYRVEIKTHNKPLYVAMLIVCLIFAMLFRYGYIEEFREENFPTIVLAVLTAILAYSGVYAVNSRISLPIIFISALIGILIGFKALILLVFLSTSLSFGLLKIRYFLLSIPLILIMMGVASQYRASIEGDITSKLFALITSHYDSWSFMVVAFSNLDVSVLDNLYAWFISMVTLIPGMTGIGDFKTYGRYLNTAYTGEWLEYASVLLSPGIVGEFWSLGIVVPFFGLPAIVIAYDCLYKRALSFGAPYALILLSSSIFLLEAPISNLGQLIKALIVVYFLNKFLFKNTLVKVET